MTCFRPVPVLVLAALAGIGGSVRAEDVFIKPVSEGPVQVEDRRIRVDGVPFFLNGVGYQPVPIGVDVGAPIYAQPEIYQRDLAFLRSIGCNTLRTWGGAGDKGFLDACYNGGVDPIYVITGPWIDIDIDLGDPAVREKITAEWKAFVTEWKDHPAILMWQIGNEYNYWYKHDITVFHRFANEIARLAYELEGESYHPFTIAHGGIRNASAPIGDPAFFTDDASLNYIDVWGANVYSGASFEELFEIYSFRSTKPLWISEFGCDALDDRTKKEYPDVHAAFVAGLWDELIEYSDIVSGGTIMAYSDEWWKGGNPAVHDKNGWRSGAQPDGVSNEEWYGIVAVEKQEDGPDRILPRPVCDELKARWTTPVVFKDLADREFKVSRDRVQGIRKDIQTDSVVPGEPVVRDDILRVSGSSVESDATPPEDAVDGAHTTRWSSEHGIDPSWWMLELKEPKRLTSIQVQWETAAARSYAVEVSDDGSSWTRVAEVTDGSNDERRELYFSPVTTRFLRILGRERTTEWGYSIEEVSLNPDAGAFH